MKPLKKHINDDKGYYNIVYKNKMYVEHHLNGSFTISDDKGNKETYYGYSLTKAKTKFRQEHPLRSD